MTHREQVQVHEVFKRFSDSIWYYRSHGIDMEKQDPATGRSISDQLISTLYNDCQKIKEGTYVSKDEE